MEILLATKNKNKYIELKNIFDQSNSQHELLFYSDLIEVVEDKETIFENAKKKATEVYKEYQKPVIADDSGLFVNSLNGQPGVKSARYAGDQASDEENIKKLLDDLANEENRGAYFKTVLFFYDGSNELTSEGILDGQITFERRGNNGFGYDPIFKYEDKTLAELSLNEKTNISHRNIACIKMVELLNEKI